MALEASMFPLSFSALLKSFYKLFKIDLPDMLVEQDGIFNGNLSSKGKY